MMTWRNCQLAASTAACLALLACADASGDSNGPPPPPPTYPADYGFQVAGHPESVLLAITSPTGLLQADSLVGTGTTRWGVGRPVQGDGGFNTGWSWHLDPATIAFAEITIEACQTWPSAVEQHLAYWLNFGSVCIAGTVTALPSASPAHAGQGTFPAGPA